MKVKVKLIKESIKFKKDIIIEFEFEHAQRMFQEDKHGRIFAVAEPKKWKWDGQELVKQSSKDKTDK